MKKIKAGPVLNLPKSKKEKDYYWKSL